MELTGRHLKLPRDDQAPLKARDWIEELAPAVPSEVRGDLTLLTHELVTNAVQHADGESIWLAAVVSPEVVRVEVCDQGGSTEPHLAPPEAFATSGRGLRWVKALSDRWGKARRRVNHVWFQIDVGSREVSRSPERANTN